MIGLAVTLGGVLIGVMGWFMLRRSGSGWRIGRLLSAAPQRSLADAADMARRGEEAYVRLHGRIDADEEFPGDDDKPIVFRRRRLQRRTGRSAWQTFDDERLAVPFGLLERGQRVAVDTDALGDGLVVVPRISSGTAADLTPDAAAAPIPEMRDDTLVRLRIEQVSAVDHGTASGVPRLGSEGETVLGPGLGRPLILTTLELGEAMRILAADQRRSLLVASGLLVATPIVTLVGIVLILLAP